MKPPTLTSDAMRPVVELLQSRAALVIGDDRKDQLGLALWEVMKAYDVNDIDDLVTRLMACRPYEGPLQALIERVVIGETFFFREESQFKALREVIIPDIVEYRRKPATPSADGGGQWKSRCINVVSAGCSTGEEPYSIAILLNETLPDQSNWKINIIGVDLSLAALAKARTGTYGAWSFRGVANEVVDRYFLHRGRLFELSDDIKRMVTFQYLNLAEGLPFSDLDLILWRNVGIYFSPESRKLFAARCFQALRPGGWLFVGASELSHEYFRRNETVHIGDAIAYHKSDGRIAAQQEDTPPVVSRRVIRPAIRVPESPTSPVPSKGHAVRSRSSSISVEMAAHAATVEEVEARYRRGETSTALEMLSGPLLSDPRALYLLAKIHADRGDHHQAEETCTRYIARVPHALDGYYLLALICQAEQKDELAVEALRKAIFLDRSFVMGHFGLGQLYKKLNRTSSARRHFMQVKQLLFTMSRTDVVLHSDGQTVGRILKATDQALKSLAGGQPRA